MAPHTITHCINDDTSFLCESRHSRDIKYQILMNIKFSCFPRYVSNSFKYQTLPAKCKLASL